MNQTFYLTASQPLNLNEIVNKKNDSEGRAKDYILSHKGKLGSKKNTLILTLK